METQVVRNWNYPFEIHCFRFKGLNLCVCDHVCVSVCVFLRTAGPAPSLFLLVAKGNSRLQPCWLPTDLTLTPEVNTHSACVCVFLGFITAYGADWWSRWHMWWAPLPISPCATACEFVPCECVCEHVCESMWIFLYIHFRMCVRVRVCDTVSREVRTPLRLVGGF